MKATKWNTALVGGIAALTSLVAAADTTTVAGVTATAEKSLYDKIAEKYALSYYGIYRGPGLTALGKSTQPADPSQSEDTIGPQSLESYITTGYRFNKDTLLGVSGHFIYFPMGEASGAKQTFQMLDPSLMLSRANVVDTGNLKLKLLMYAALPLTSGDILQRQKLATSIGPTAVLSYDVPHTQLNLGVYAYVKGYIPTAEATNARSYYIYVAPNATYALGKKVQATLWIDLLQAEKKMGTALSNYWVDIEPGINWDITSFLSFNPILNFYPGAPTLANTSIQAILVAKAF